VPPFALALGSSLSYGVSDFLGGMVSRRTGSLQFAFFLQLIGMLLAAAWVAISGAAVPPAGALLAAAGAGVGLAVGVAAFFQAMAIGKMSVVAPISASGVVVPVAAGIAQGERPSVAQAVGIAAAILGVVLAAREPARAPGTQPESGFGLALLSAVAIGLFLWLMVPAAHHGVPWAILISRAIPSAALIAAVRLRRVSLRSALVPRMAATILLTAVLGFGGLSLYALAAVHGELVIVSVLASLYPAVPLFLAYHLLGERISGVQQAGIVSILCGVVLLST
jgi:uncharacterized membrane protein